MFTQADWDAFAKVYASVQDHSQLPLARNIVGALDQVSPLAGRTVADVAAGSGRYTGVLAQTAGQVTAIDWSEAMLREAQRRVTAPNVAYRQANWRKLPARPIAQVVFLSQFPGLVPADLPRLTALASETVALNCQVLQNDTLLTQAALALGVSLPPVLQADASRIEIAQEWLAIRRIQAAQKEFDYSIEETVTTTDLIRDLGVPVSGTEARALAKTLSGYPDQEQPFQTTIRYHYTLLIWPSQTQPR
ncbi:class I SAM-dependent methyltransferase [Lacticaseibacillus mingshuiensis]|uniref:Class I SAM-dependent methyltransferase n=1 Tax=Lacticaseibacillus mingshuiensis TaxID=2799574 RepID=A0ABW4CEL1_9LACO|nr:class I SAM-dependent methyltransferase [Lacticaseibacillus mingshuiensis]